MSIQAKKQDLIDKLGSDLQFPIANIFTPISGLDLLLQDIQTLLLTSPGERVMNPRYGSGLKALLWENMDDAFSRAPAAIRSAIKDYEPRITLTAVDASMNRESGLLVFNIRFIVNATGVQANLVFPLRLANQLTFG